MTPIDALLERVARDEASEVHNFAIYYPNFTNRFKNILERELKPLLLAGAKIREHVSAILRVDDAAITNADTLKILDEWIDRCEEVRAVIMAWDRALKGGRDAELSKDNASDVR